MLVLPAQLLELADEVASVRARMHSMTPGELLRCLFSFFERVPQTAYLAKNALEGTRLLSWAERAAILPCQGEFASILKQLFEQLGTKEVPGRFIEPESGGSSGSS